MLNEDKTLEYLDFDVGGMYTPQDVLRIIRVHSPELFTITNAFSDEELKAHQTKTGQK